MHYTQEMMLQSTSGYCMPFEERDKDVEMSLGYGRQKHPQTGEMFFHHGIDLQPWLQERCRESVLMPFMVSIRSSAMVITKLPIPI